MAHSTPGVSLRAPGVALVLAAMLIVLPLPTIGPVPAMGPLPAHAQDACAAEVEPNDEPATALPMAAPGCAEASLAGDDKQDLYIWRVSEADAGSHWRLTLTGIPDVATSVQVLPITSAQGVSPPEVGPSLTRLDVAPDATEPGSSGDLLIPPGTYVAAVFRSDFLLDTPAFTDYRLAIERGDPLPASVEVEPNDDAATGTPVAGAFVVRGDRTGSDDAFSWVLGEMPSGTGATIRVQGRPGSVFTLALAAEDGASIQTAYSDARAAALLSDLRLPPGRYVITVGRADVGPEPYVLSAVLGPTGEGDPEPNDTLDRVLPLPIGTLVSGRLGRPGDQDLYLLRVDEATAGSLIDAKLLGPDAPWRELCLSQVGDGMVGATLRCAAGVGPLAVTGLALPVGDHLFSVRSTEASDAPYYLRIDATAPAVVDFEMEPNDQPTLATPMMDDIAMRGRLSDGDTDTFRARVDGELRLWAGEVVGDGVATLEWIGPDGALLSSGGLLPGGTTPALTDMLLIPGEHWFRLTGTGDYQLRLTSLGPPDPAAEREPNDASLFAQPLLIGATRTGRLATTSDRDVSRLSLAATEHLRFRLEPPADGAIDLGVADTVDWLARPFSGAPGEPVEYEAVLPAGDYEVWLDAATPAAGRYALTVERLDPFLVPADAEPNDDPGRASDMPATLRVEGTGRPYGDIDWYRLPALPADGQLAFRATGGRRLLLSDGTLDLVLAELDDGRLQTDFLPAGTSLLVGVDSVDPYRLEIDPGSTGLAAAPAPPESDMTESRIRLDLQVPDTPVAAWWPQGQRLGAVVRITNEADQDLDIVLETASSHYKVALEPDSRAVTLPAGASLEVPAMIYVDRDAWADTPVRLTVRAMAGTGVVVTDFVELTPSRTADPVGATAAWPLPEAILGGVDVASLAAGATVVPTFDPAGEALLHDGIAPPGSGLYGTPPVWPLELTVDLAGDEPVPIRGTILHPVSGGSSPADVPRAVQLLLSGDGATWEPALSGELVPDGREQAFVMDQPVPARFARLRIDSTWGSTGGVTLGEWKVVAEPGAPVAWSPPGPSGPAAPSSQPDIADPALGGHIAWLDPQLYAQSEADGLLVEDLTSASIEVRKGGAPSFAIGFRDARVARLDRLEWTDAPGSDPASLIRSPDVAVSYEGAAGPWRSLGTWSLRRAADGSVGPFAFPEGTWARYVRLTGEPRRKAGWVTLPATVRVFERATSPGERSILGEWGMGERSGPAEWLAAQQAPADPSTGSSGPTPGSSADDAPDLAPGVPASGRVHRGEDEDWYGLAVPEGPNSVAITLRGVPSVGAAVELVEADGTVVPASLEVGTDPGSVVYTAPVTSGQRYALRVTQPPYSAVFAFDTSGSVAGYLPFVYGALRSFTEAVQEGAEAIKMMPFEERPLLEDWSDQRFVLQDAVNRYVSQGGSSSAETALLDSLRELAVRPGTRAILLITDAETSSYDKNADLWKQLAGVRPIIHALQVSSALPEAQHFMQDWAAVADGHYEYVTRHAEIDRAFDRMATNLRRPVRYALSYDFSQERPPEPAPGAISVERGASTAGAEAPAGPAADSDVAVALVLDTSGSMLAKLGKKRRIDVAKSVLRDLVTDVLPPGTPVSLRVFRQVPKSCQTELAVPLGPLDPTSLGPLIDSISVDKRIGTPLAAAIEAVGQDLAAVQGPRIAVVVSDGQESCGGDPESAVRAMVAEGVDIRLNIVGLDLDRASRRRIAKLAQVGNGAYYDARDPAGLSAALESAVSPPVRVLAEDGSLVAAGTLGGEPIPVPPGVYRVEVLTEPPRTFDRVLVNAGQTAQLSIAEGDGT